MVAVAATTVTSGVDFTINKASASITDGNWCVFHTSGYSYAILGVTGTLTSETWQASFDNGTTWVALPADADGVILRPLTTVSGYLMALPSQIRYLGGASTSAVPYVELRKLNSRIT